MKTVLKKVIVFGMILAMLVAVLPISNIEAKEKAAKLSGEKTGNDAKLTLKEKREENYNTRFKPIGPRKDSETTTTGQTVCASVNQVETTVFSGETFHIQLLLKVTGVEGELTNGLITITLPEGVSLASNLQDLAISGIVPKFNGVTLTWKLDKIKSGMSVKKNIGIKTENGITIPGTNYEVKAKVSADQLENLVEVNCNCAINVSATLSNTIVATGVTEAGEEPVPSKKMNPLPGETMGFNIDVSSPSKTKGGSYLQEGSDVTIQMLMRNSYATLTGLYYKGNQVSVPEVEHDAAGAGWDAYTFTVQAPSIAEQKASATDNYLFHLTTLKAAVKIKDDVGAFKSVSVYSTSKGISLDGNYFTSSRVSASVTTTTTSNSYDIYTPDGTSIWNYLIRSYDGTNFAYDDGTMPTLKAGNKNYYKFIANATGPIALRQGTYATEDGKIRPYDENDGQAEPKGSWSGYIRDALPKYDMTFNIGKGEDFIGLRMPKATIGTTEATEAGNGDLPYTPVFDIQVKYNGDSDYTTIKSGLTGPCNVDVSKIVDNEKGVSNVRLHWTKPVAGMQYFWGGSNGALLTTSVKAGFYGTSTTTMNVTAASNFFFDSFGFDYDWTGYSFGLLNEEGQHIGAIRWDKNGYVPDGVPTIQEDSTLSAADKERILAENPFKDEPNSVGFRVKAAWPNTGIANTDLFQHYYGTSTFVVNRPETGQGKVFINNIGFANENSEDIIDSGVIDSGKENLHLSLSSDQSSQYNIAGKFYSYVDLPEGVLLDGTTDGVTIINDKYNGNHTLLKVKWGLNSLSIGNSVTMDIPVIIPDDYSSYFLPIKMYTITGENDSNYPVDVPSVSTSSITDTTKVDNPLELGIEGISPDDVVFATGNEYRVINALGNNLYLESETINATGVSGKMVNVSRGSIATFDLHMDSGTDKELRKVTIYGTLPQINDKDITTDTEVHSSSNPDLVGPIKFVDKTRSLRGTSKKLDNTREDTTWQSGTIVYYGTSENVKELSSNDWKKEDEVSDWSKIKSFKIVSKEDAVLPSQNIDIQYDVKISANENIGSEGYAKFSMSANSLDETETLKTGFRVVKSSSSGGDTINTPGDTDGGGNKGGGTKTPGTTGKKTSTKTKVSHTISSRPSTSDLANIVPFAIVGVIALVVIIGGIIWKKKK
ncbi:MAG: hypothetical protein LBM02_06355 [Lachnospiraceae bacterium]|nr:hypothetical protein [Lachnospiraceae bacterium]